MYNALGRNYDAFKRRKQGNAGYVDLGEGDFTIERDYLTTLKKFPPPGVEFARTSRKRDGQTVNVWQISPMHNAAAPQHAAAAPVQHDDDDENAENAMDVEDDGDGTVGRHQVTRLLRCHGLKDLEDTVEDLLADFVERASKNSRPGVKAQVQARVQEAFEELFNPAPPLVDKEAEAATAICRRIGDVIRQLQTRGTQFVDTHLFLKRLVHACSTDEVPQKAILRALGLPKWAFQHHSKDLSEFNDAVFGKGSTNVDADAETDSEREYDDVDEDDIEVVDGEAHLHGVEDQVVHAAKEPEGNRGHPESRAFQDPTQPSRPCSGSLTG